MRSIENASIALSLLAKSTIMHIYATDNSGSIISMGTCNNNCAIAYNGKYICLLMRFLQ